jgi:(R,R)-butanediol dehydrogenase/meso-butanediol dehydrogenase/diacetyl reductase
MRMPAVRLHAVGDLRFEDIEAPERPGEREVIVAVEAAGICGSDLHNYRTGQWLTRAPSVPGHEFCGTVIAAGEGVVALKPGDRVIADSRVFCRTCRHCRSGTPQLCRSIGYVGEVIDGGFAARVRLPEHQLVRLPDQQTPAAVAAMAEPLAVALHATGRLEPRRDAPILITGAGPIGALTAIVLAEGGFGPLHVIDRNEARCHLVARLTGARPVAAADIEAAVGDWRLYAVETTGSASVARLLIDTLTAGGRMASVGIFHEEATLDLNRVVEGEIELTGSAAFGDELGKAVEMLGGLSAKLDALAAPPISLAEVPRAYDVLCQGRSETVKTIIVPSENQTAKSPLTLRRDMI